MTENDLHGVTAALEGVSQRYQGHLAADFDEAKAREVIKHMVEFYNSVQPLTRVFAMSVTLPNFCQLTLGADLDLKFVNPWFTFHPETIRDCSPASP